MAFLAALAADWTQTTQIAAHPEQYREINPILGDHPNRTQVDAYFAFSAVGHYLISRALPADYRIYWQSVTLAVESGFVAHNVSIGLKIGF